MDCQMPGVDGYDAAEQIRARYNGAGAPVIAVTADASPENRERCHAAGMNDYVTKPASISILIDVLNRWVPQDDPVRAG
jgi:CheY-like chemotaxis protein